MNSTFSYGQDLQEYLNANISPQGLSLITKTTDGATHALSTWQFVSSNFENIFLITFLKPKTAENRQLALGILLIVSPRKCNKML